MHLTIKGVKLMDFDHDLADSVGLYSVLDVEMRSSGSAAAIQGTSSTSATTKKLTTQLPARHSWA